MTKKSRQKFKYLENEKSFYGEIKSIFHYFKGLSVAKNCLRPESASVNFVGRENGLKYKNHEVKKKMQIEKFYLNNLQNFRTVRTQWEA